MENRNYKLIYTNLDYLSMNIYSFESKFKELYEKYKEFVSGNDFNLSEHLNSNEYIKFSELFSDLSFNSFFFKFYSGKYPYKLRLLIYYKYRNRFYLVAVIFFADDFNNFKMSKLSNGNISFSGNIFVELKGQFFYFDKFLNYKMTDFLDTFLGYYTNNTIHAVKYSRIDYCFDFVMDNRNKFNEYYFEYFNENVLLKNKERNYSVYNKAKIFSGFMIGSKNHQYFSIVSYYKTERNILYTSYLLLHHLTASSLQRIEFRIFKDYFKKRHIDNSVYYVNMYENIYVLTFDIMMSVKEFKEFLNFSNIDVSNINGENENMDTFKHFIKSVEEKDYNKDLKRVLSNIASFIVKYNIKVKGFIRILLNQIISIYSHFRKKIAVERKKLYKSAFLFGSNEFVEEDSFL